PTPPRRERMPEMPPIIVVSGLPGAGKSTTAARIAQALPRAAHIEADRLQQLIVSGGRWPSRDAALDDEAARQLSLRLRNACARPRAFRAAGFAAIVDEICIGTRLDELRRELATPFHFVMLHPSLAALAARNATRAKRDAFEQSRALHRVIEHETERIGLWLDTSALDVEQTVRTILARLDDARVE